MLSVLPGQFTYPDKCDLLSVFYDDKPVLIPAYLFRIEVSTFNSVFFPRNRFAAIFYYRLTEGKGYKIIVRS